MAKKAKKMAPASRPANRPASKGKARSYPRPQAGINPMPLKILMGVLAALCLVGGIYIATRPEVEFNSGLIIELVLLALIAALSVFAAVRTETVAALFSKLSK